MITLISTEHFFGNRNLTPLPNTDARDLARLIIELQGALNGSASDISGLESVAGIMAPSYVAIDDGDTPYTVADGVNFIGVDTTTAVVTVVLPDPTTVPVGVPIVIKDEGGNAGTNAITVQGTVDGETDPTITTDYGKIEVYSNGTVFFNR